MKSSNPKVMVQAYRLLVKTMNQQNMHYPLHLGVTEAGDGDDGRIKSAIGIGSLLEDGLGDTIRVSLTEDPEFEIPVAKKIISRFENSIAVQNRSPITDHRSPITDHRSPDWDPYEFNKRESFEVENIGGKNVPRVLADFSFKEKISVKDLEAVGYFYHESTDKWHSVESACDYIFFGNTQCDFMLPAGLKGICHSKTWNSVINKQNNFPLFYSSDFSGNKRTGSFSQTLNFLLLNASEISEEFLTGSDLPQNFVLILQSRSPHPMKEIRNAFFLLEEKKIKNPVIIACNYSTPLSFGEGPGERSDEETVMLNAAIDAGSLLIDGFGDGIFIASKDGSIQRTNDFSFGILQATRSRITKTEYISCPSCGRTLFDLQETTSMIRKQTDHLKGIKIAIMGCIVNGPGEMADADYGYVGSGPGKITLYKGKDVVKKGVDKETAVTELIALIKSDGNWKEI
ncbi:MAG: flavodoxin-dependent (E)-4-hydroxy-3-methylbut-2-enyl-diphosphate synthase, partial [Bacteroidia bacterium]